MKFKPSNIFKVAMPFALSFGLIASAVAPVSAAQSFTDVSDRYEESVDYLKNFGIANGISATQFGTSQKIKRGDAAIMLAHSLNLTEKAAPMSGFRDVPTRGIVAINALKQEGIVNGKTATNFGFNDWITRGEMALMLANAPNYNLEGEEVTLRFKDVSPRYADAVAALVSREITSGKSADRFGTGDLLTRGEFAIFMHRTDKTLGRQPVAPQIVLEYEGLWETHREAEEDPYLNVKIKNVDGFDAEVSVNSMSPGAMYVASVDGKVRFAHDKARIYYANDGHLGSGVITLTLANDRVHVTVVKSNDRGYLFEGKYETTRR